MIKRYKAWRFKVFSALMEKWLRENKFHLASALKYPLTGKF